MYYSPISQETPDDVPRHTMVSGKRGWETLIQTMDKIQEINFTLHTSLTLRVLLHFLEGLTSFLIAY
jgi:hypothetical protein